MVVSSLLEFVKVLFDPHDGRDVAPLCRHLHQANRRLSEQEQTLFNDLRRRFSKLKGFFLVNQLKGGSCLTMISEWGVTPPSP